MTLPRIIDHATSLDQDIPCATCGRMVGRAAALSDRPGYHGLDCAARILGRPKSRQSYDTIELEAREATARAKGTAAGDAMRRAVGRLRDRAEWFAEYGGNGTKAENERANYIGRHMQCPYLVNSAEYHAWFYAALVEWGRK